LAPGGGVGAGEDGAASSRTSVQGAPRRAVGRHHRQPQCQDGHAKQGGGDGDKQSTGRQRPLLFDTRGLIGAVVVTGAHVGDRQGLRALWNRYLAEGVPRVRKLWVEGGYRAAWLHAGVWSLKRTHTMALEVVEPTGQGFQGVPYRWVVER